MPLREPSGEIRSSLPPEVLVLAPELGALEARALRAASTGVTLTVTRSLEQACRVIADRSPEVVVVDSGNASDGVADRLLASHDSLGRAPRLVSSSVNAFGLPKDVVSLAQTERVARAAATSAERATCLQFHGRMAQWQLDPESKLFRWLDGRCSIFSALCGSGSLESCLLGFVHTGDRARVALDVMNAGAPDDEFRLILPNGSEHHVVQRVTEGRDVRTGRRVLLGTMRDITKEREAERELLKLAHYDAATGLPNRGHLLAFLRTLDSRPESSSSVCVLAIGIDAFRTFEDTLGREASEAVLRAIGSRLQGALEHFGTSAGMVARHGWWELAVVLVQADETQARTFFDHVSAKLSEPVWIEDIPVVVTCSAGVAVYDIRERGDLARAETMIANADAALHAAMALGRSNFSVYADQIKQTLARRQMIEGRLRRCLAESSGLELHYQPKVDARTSETKSLEALLRSGSHSSGPISPLELVSVAEERGLVHPLGDFVLRTACMQGRRWAEAGKPLRIAVNISAHQLARADFVEHVSGILGDTGFPPELLELEITEGAMMADIEGACQLLTRLKGTGVHLALDDFGTGYSSLAYLTRLPIDTLKIDRAFISAIGRSKENEAIVTAIIALSCQLGLQVVAEGVETEAQRDFLAPLGNLELQGWLFSKALPSGDVLEWIDKHDAHRKEHAALR